MPMSMPRTMPRPWHVGMSGHASHKYCAKVLTAVHCTMYNAQGGVVPCTYLPTYYAPSTVPTTHVVQYLLRT